MYVTNLTKKSIENMEDKFPQSLYLSAKMSYNMSNLIFQELSNNIERSKHPSNTLWNLQIMHTYHGE